MNERAQYVCKLYSQIYPEIQVDEETKIKGTSIEKLCQFDGPGFRRIKSWCEEKLSQLASQMKTELVPSEEFSSIDDDMVQAEKQFKECFALMCSRNKKYGDSWKVLSIASIANLIEMKVHRVAQLGEKDTKAWDEFQDSCNYAIFALIKLSQKKEE